MTQVKKVASKAKKAVDLRSEFLKLESIEQDAIANFFNLHNAAHFIFDRLSDPAKQYVTYCIQLSSEANKIEKKQDV